MSTAEQSRQLRNVKSVDPAKISSEFCKRYSIDGAVKLRHWNGSWWLWSKGRYVDTPESEIRAGVLHFMREKWAHVKREHVANVIEHLRADTILPAGLSAPAWVGSSSPEFDASECLATPSQVIHLPTLAKGGSDWQVSATPDFFTLSACAVDFDETAPPPTLFIEKLGEWFPNDPESISTIQEIGGCLISGSTQFQKIFFWYGPTRCGKGTIMRVLRGIVGDDNIASPSCSLLAGRFGLESILGKSIAFISDARLSNRADAITLLENLLAVSGEDSPTVDRKGKRAVTCRKGAQFVLASNELPRIPDASAAIVGRIIAILFTQSFFDREDTDLDRKLAAELPSIFNWFMDGLKRLRQRGRFQQPASGAGILQQFRELASPVRAFVDDRCELGAELSCPKHELYAEFQRWCASENLSNVPTQTVFGRNLAAAYPELSDARPRGNGGSRVRQYVGIRLRTTDCGGVDF
jgi:putative DNA primase/helicase